MVEPVSHTRQGRRSRSYRIGHPLGAAAAATGCHTALVSDRALRRPLGRSHVDRREEKVMSDLVVVGFKGDRSRASQVLDRLRELDFRWVIDLESAVAMYRDLDGTLHVRQDPELTTGEGVALGVLQSSLTPAQIAALEECLHKHSK